MFQRVSENSKSGETSVQLMLLHRSCTPFLCYSYNSSKGLTCQKAKQQWHERISNKCAAWSLIRLGAAPHCYLPSAPLMTEFQTTCSFGKNYSDSCLRRLLHYRSCSSPIFQEQSEAKQTEIQQIFGGFHPFIKSSLFNQFLIKQPSSQTPTKLIFWITVSELFFSINEAQLSDLCHFTDSFICGRGVYEILQLPGSQWLCTDLHNSVCIPTPGGRNTAYITLPFLASQRSLITGTWHPPTHAPSPLLICKFRSKGLFRAAECLD